MNPDDVEQRLRNGSWPELRPEVKGALVRKAARKLAARRRGRAFRWVLATAAALLIAINVVAERGHERRMAAITGGPAIQRPVPPAVYADALRYRAQLLSESVERIGNS